MVDPAELRTLFDQVVSLPASDRAAFLDRACRNDSALRGELERLLAAHDGPGSIFDTHASNANADASACDDDGAPSALAPGTALGPYLIGGAVGAGGMGEVYKARDTRLDRTVAIKVLSRGMMRDAAARQRLEREARAVAGLSHPNICTLYDIGHKDDINYLVMEFLDGETLARRLRRRRIPLDEALRYAVEIAEALAVAHRAGIVHRDLKPGNVMLTGGGVKLLDFGLAKRLRIANDASRTPESGEPVTQQGVIRGTLPYMAPEQLEGREADARTDIWALGAILYEMLTGRRAFEGNSTAALIGEILHTTPPALSGQQPLTAPALERLVRKCLAKQPDGRWDTAHDLADELRWIRENLAFLGLPTGRDRRRRGLSKAVVGAAVLVTAAVGAGLMWLLRRPEPGPSLAHVSLDVRPAEELNGGGSSSRLMTPGGSRTALTWTPDGKALVFVGRRAGVQHLYLRRLDGAEARPLAGTTGAQTPAVSPDGQSVAFWADGTIRKVPLAGGPVMDVAPGIGSPPWGLAWTAGGELLFGGRGEPIREVTAAGVVTAVTAVGETEISHGLPWPLPGGRHLLFTARRRERSWGDEEIVVQTLATGARKVLLRDAADARFVPTGHLLFLRRGVLVAVPFDPERLEISGAQVPVIEAVAQALTSSNSLDFTGAGQFAVSRSGALAWVPNSTVRYPDNRLVTVDQRGQVSGLGAPARSYSPVVRVVPNGGRVMVALDGLTERSLWLYDLDRRILSPLLRDGEVTWPLWWPHEERAVFQWLKEGRYSVATYAVDGTAAPQILLTRMQPDSAWHAPIIPSSIAPDGRHLAVVLQEPGREDVFIATLGGQNTRPRRWLETPESKGWPEFSPDGRWLAYASKAAGDYEVFVRPYPGPGPAYQVSVDGGSSPAWHPAGRELFFLSPFDAAGKGRMMVASIEPGSPLRLGTPRRLFEFNRNELGFSCVPARCFDVAPDGQRFYVTQAVGEPPAPPVTHINLILNWSEQLHARVTMQ